jgi:hypothetical protein
LLTRYVPEFRGCCALLGGSRREGLTCSEIADEMGKYKE